MVSIRVAVGFKVGRDVRRSGCVYQRHVVYLVSATRHYKLPAMLNDCAAAVIDVDQSHHTGCSIASKLIGISIRGASAANSLI